MIPKSKSFPSKVKTGVMWRRQLHVMEGNTRRQHYTQFNETECKGGRGRTKDAWLKEDVDFSVSFGSNCKHATGTLVMYYLYYSNGILSVTHGIFSTSVLHIQINRKTNKKKKNTLDS